MNKMKPRGCFLGDKNVLYLDWGVSYRDTHNIQKTSNATMKNYVF